MCEGSQGYQVLTVDNKTIEEAGQVVHKTDCGFICLNREQAFNETCFDYKVRQCCPYYETTSSQPGDLVIGTEAPQTSEPAKTPQTTEPAETPQTEQETVASTETTEQEPVASTVASTETTEQELVASTETTEQEPAETTETEPTTATDSTPIPIRPCTEEENRCGAGAICEIIDESPVCSCKPGASGDPLLRCCGKFLFLDNLKIVFILKTFISFELKISH